MKPKEQFTDDEKEAILRAVKFMAVQSGWPKECVGERLATLYVGARRLARSTELLTSAECLGKLLHESLGSDSIGSVQDVLNTGETGASKMPPL